MRTRTHARVFLVLASCMVAFACAEQPQEPPDNRAADAAAIRQADIAWAKAAETNGLEGLISYYTDDVMVLPPNMPILVGKDSVRKDLAGLFNMPGFSLKFQPVKVEAARSGEIGYVQGTYEMTMNDPKGTPMTDKGKYIEIWKKQPDGSWKCAVDTFNSDMPPAPPVPTPTMK